MNVFLRAAAALIALCALSIGGALGIGTVMPTHFLIAYTRYLANYVPDQHYFLRDLNRCLEHMIALPIQITAVAWSPDGERIAFVGGENTDATRLDIYVIDWDGSNMRQITDSPARDYAPAWMPDSRRLAFASDRENDDDIYVIDLDSGETRKLFESGMNEYQASFSPDGRYVAYPMSDATNTAAYIFIRELATDVVTEVVEGARYSFSPQWTHDSQRVLFLNLSERGEAEIRAFDVSDSTTDTQVLYVQSPNSAEQYRSINVLDEAGRIVIVADPMSAGLPGAWWMKVLEPDGTVSDVGCAPRANFVTVHP